MEESKIISKAILITVAISIFTFSSGNLAFSSDEIVVNNKEDAIVIVGGGPVAFSLNISNGNCNMSSSIALFTGLHVPKGEKHIIKVLGDDDIVFECLGTKGVKIKKD